MYNCKASRTFYSYKVAKQLVRDIHQLNILKDNDDMGKIRHKVFIIHLHARMKINMGLKKYCGTACSQFSDESDSLKMKKL